MQQLELQSFLQQNAFCIYTFINEQILKNSAVMHPDYFMKIVNEYVDSNPQSSFDLELLPYNLLSTIAGTGIIAYTSLRKGTIDFSQLNKESKTYYNYVRFSIKDEMTFMIELMQSKIGGMPIDEDMVKFSKQIVIKQSALTDFIKQQSSYQVILEQSKDEIMAQYNENEAIKLLSEKQKYEQINRAFS